MPERAPADAAPTTAPGMVDDDTYLRNFGLTDAPAFVIFWILAGVVFLQFFTRYVLNNSLGWTEEIARYLLILVCFVGAITAVRRQTHIAVEIFYRWFPMSLRRALSALVDIGSIAFYAYMTRLCARLALRTGQMMVSIDIPKSSLYWIVTAAFAAMTLWSVVVFVRHLRTGSSPLIDQPMPKLAD